MGVIQQREDIVDPDMEFAGMAAKSMAKSCDKDGSCEPQENVWDYLPDVEVRFTTVALTLLPPPPFFYGDFFRAFLEGEWRPMQANVSQFSLT